MRRFLSILLIISCLLILEACNQKPVQTDNAASPVPTQSEAVPSQGMKPSASSEHTRSTKDLKKADKTKITVSPVPTKAIAESGYDVIDITAARKDGGAMDYPMLLGMKNTELQNRINMLIMEDILAFADAVQTEGVTIDASYKISWQGKQLLSILYTMYYEAKGAAHPSILFHTLNIDLKNAKKLRLRDVIDIDSELAAKLKEASAYAGPLEKEDNPSELLAEYLGQLEEKALTAADSNESNDTIQSYFTETSLGIAIPVPHVVGDYAEYEINYNEIRDYLQLDNPIWDDFPDLFAE